MDKTIEQLLAPVKELNELTVKSIEKIAAIQVKAIQDNTKVSIDLLKSANEINDDKSLRKYLESQVSNALDLSNKTMEDTQKIQQLCENYVSDVQGVVGKSVK